MKIDRLFISGQGGAPPYELTPGLNVVRSGIDFSGFFARMLYGSKDSSPLGGGLLADYGDDRLIALTSDGGSAGLSALRASDGAPDQRITAENAGIKLTGFGLQDFIRSSTPPPALLKAQEGGKAAIEAEVREAQQAVTRGDRLLDRRYYTEVKSACEAASRARAASGGTFDSAKRDQMISAAKQDSERAERLAKVRNGKIRLIISLVLAAVALATLAVPVEPFLARLPLTGIAASLSGIFAVAAVSGRHKYKRAQLELREILGFYGAASPADVAPRAELLMNRAPAVTAAEKDALAMLRIAFPGVRSLDGAPELLGKLDSLLTRYEKAAAVYETSRSGVDSRAEAARAALNADYIAFCRSREYSSSNATDAARYAVDLRSTVAELYAAVTAGSVPSDAVPSLFGEGGNSAKFPAEEIYKLELLLRVAAQDLSAGFRGGLTPFVLFSTFDQLSDADMRTMMRLLIYISQRRQVLLFTRGRRELDYISVKKGVNSIDMDEMTEKNS